MARHSPELGYRKLLYNDSNEVTAAVFVGSRAKMFRVFNGLIQWIITPANVFMNNPNGNVLVSFMTTVQNLFMQQIKNIVNT
ncbi:unnamed protein product [Allacma fusca]|uniref:Uncharacterized protein n=1 Tax=Allacma fusca TaxID=39272 RepID=A0A8J2NV87_9HEXA|nr:unnamed protein product [Allacma fusca]